MKKFKSKIGLELVIPLSILFGWILIQMLYDKIWIGAIVILAVISFLFYTFSTIEYSVVDDNLFIKAGFLCKEKIKIQTIRKLTETNNLLSSPAASIDRIEILYNKFDTVLVSPKDKTDFINCLTAINQDIEVKLKTKS